MADQGCIPRERTTRVRLFPLDACDRIQTGAAAVMDWDGFETIAFTDQVDAGERETIQTTSGAVCRDKVACAIDRGQQLVFNECSENWSLMSIAGYGTLVMSLNDIIGFDRTALDCTAAVAVEIIFELPVSCTGDNPLCLVRLYPKLERWVIGGEKTVNGRAVLRGQYTAQAVKNAHVFENFANDTPTGELEYWAPFIAEVNAGDSFYYDRIVECPNLVAAQGCDLRAFDLTDIS